MHKNERPPTGVRIFVSQFFFTRFDKKFTNQPEKERNRELFDQMLLCFTITVLLTFARCSLTLRDQLMDAVVIADAERVDQLLAHDPLILSSNNPIIAVDSKDENFGRSAIMVGSVY